MDKKKEKFYAKGLRFECTGCGNCCKLDGGKVFVTAKEAETIAAFLHITEEEFHQRYIADREQGKYVLKDGDADNCIFLKNNRCEIYEVRPIQCKTFPFWHENIKSLYRWKIIAQDCPGINRGRLFTVEEIVQVLNGDKTVENLREE